MVMLVLSMFCFGAVLGMRFKVLVLIPAIGLAFIATLAGGLVRGDKASVVLIAVVVASSSLQIGYLGGILTRYGRRAMARPQRKTTLHPERAG